MTLAKDLARALATTEDFEAPLASIPYAVFLGLRFGRQAGALFLRMPFKEALVGAPFPPRLHGGTLGALMEFAGAIAVFAAQSEQGDTPAGFAKPIGITIDYMRAGAPKDSFARGEVQRLGRRVVNVHSWAWQDAPSRPIAAARMHFLIADEGSHPKTPQSPIKK
ncbi:MAG: PaaI family thioesterase [Pseudomonadota bacterium]|jgi:uncharacterized protein (TIGR00369 family)